MTRIAILGSCITRDLWPIRGAGAEDLLYISRTSLPSLFAPAVEGFRPAAKPPPPLKGNQHKALVADLQKTALERLVAFAPTHIIFDFIDERFDLLAPPQTLVTRSWELEASGYLRQKVFRRARTIPRLSLACERLWRDGAAEFAAFLRATPLRDARAILHRSRWAGQVREPGGAQRPLTGVEIYAGVPADIDENNALLAGYEALFCELLPHVAVVDAPDVRLADPGHNWGLSPFHYVPQYYEEIARQLRSLGVPVPTTVPAAPSVPAA